MGKNKTTPKFIEEKVKNVQTGIPVHGVAGILLAVVCISMGYNAFLVITGTDGLFNEIMSAPSVLFIGAFLLYKAWK